MRQPAAHRQRQVSSQWGGTYLAWFFGLLFVLVVCVGGVNAIVDPHARLLLIDLPGFNQAKVSLARNSRTGKANVIRQCHIDTIVLGTSRAETAIDFGHPDFAGTQPYNAALRGGTLYEMRRLTEYAIQHQHLKTVYLSLDIEAFNAAYIDREDFADSPLAEGTTVASMANYLLSVKTFGESVSTLRANMQGKTELCQDSGEHIRTYDLIAARKTFDFILKRYAEGHYRDYVQADVHYENLAEILRILEQANVKVYAFTSPMHITHRELMIEMGLGDAYDEWRRRLVDIFARINVEYPESPQAVLWDFSGYNEITTEEVPDPEKREFMRWYDDSSHFNKEVGNIMLDVMAGLATAESTQVGAFGRPLTKDTIDAVIEADKKAADQYRLEHKDEILRLQRMLQVIE